VATMMAAMENALHVPIPPPAILRIGVANAPENGAAESAATRVKHVPMRRSVRSVFLNALVSVPVRLMVVGTLAQPTFVPGAATKRHAKMGSLTSIVDRMGSHATPALETKTASTEFVNPLVFRKPAPS